MISIYLDDLRTPLEPPSPNSHWAVIRNYEDFVNLIEDVGLENIEVISFDHDLDRSATMHYLEYVKNNYEIDYSKIKEPTGLDAVKWLVAHSLTTGKQIPKCYVHSANPIGSGNMMGYLNLYLKNCKRPEDCIRVIWDHEMNGRIFRK